MRTHLPEAELWLLTEVPSGGPSPTMLGSWTLGGGEKAGGLSPCSCSSFFGTAREKKGWGRGRSVGVGGGGGGGGNTRTSMV